MFKKEWIIYEVVSGSNAYGLATPESDIDIKGVCIPPIEYFFSPFKNYEQYEDRENDITIFALKKFVKLASMANPNVIELLFIDEKWIRTITPAGQLLRDNRDLFLSAKAKFTYSGYSFQQLKRLKNHYYWLKNPVTKQPKRSEYGLSDHKAPWSNDEYGYMEKSVENEFMEFPKEVIVVFNKEKEYRKDLKNYNNYQQWKKTRNPARAKSEAKYGMDLKFAKHLVRLMHNGKEILTKGTLTPDVSHIQAVHDVSNGKWSYDYLIKWAEDFDQELNEIYEKKQYVVPHKPDVKKIEKLVLNILKARFGVKD